LCIFLELSEITSIFTAEKCLRYDICPEKLSGVINTPIRLDNYENGMGYSLFFHFIARDIHSDIVEMLKEDIKEVSGK